MNTLKKGFSCQPRLLLLWLSIFLAGLLGLSGAPGLSQPTETSSRERDIVYLLTLDDAMISPVTAEYIAKGIEEAARNNAEALVIELDTPGGLLSSTHTIVKNILNAPLPVLVYVAPAGARAGSAGTFITLSAHVAAMEPSTRIGAAHPVDISGNWPPDGKEAEENEKSVPSDTGKAFSRPEQGTMSRKIMNDTIASIRVIARKHGRNEAWAVKAVTESASITAEEAVEKHVVDLLASDVGTLLNQAHGRTVKVLDKPVTLDLDSPSIRNYEFSTREQILSVLTHPMLSYLLLMVGFYGILFEVTHPGVGVAGLTGLVCLVLAMIGMQALAINYAGLGLIVLGLVLFAAELFTPSFGLMLGGGVVCTVLGTLLIYQTGEPFLLEVVPYMVGTTVLLAALTAVALRYIVKTYRKKPQGVREKLVGQIGRVTQEIAPDRRGKVRVYGEIWTAEAEEALEKGTEIRVEGIHQHDTKVLTVTRHVEELSVESENEEGATS